MYLFLKFVHVLGVVVLVGNVTATSIWKVFADRSGDPRVIRFGQRLVIRTDWWFTLGGIALIVIGGYGAAAVAHMDLLRDAWLLWSQVLFVLSGLIWLVVLIPIQIRQTRQAQTFSEDVSVPAEFLRDALHWIVWGVIATIPLIGAIWLMIAKPI